MQKIDNQRNENSGQYIMLLIITLNITQVEMLIKEYFTSYNSSYVTGVRLELGK